jgi:hypothetical protein
VPYVLGACAALFLVVLLCAAVTGRLRLGSCCAVADPSRDVRMSAAFEEDDARR